MENSNITPEELAKSMVDYLTKSQGYVLIDKNSLVDICHNISDEMHEFDKKAGAGSNILIQTVLEVDRIHFTSLLIRKLFMKNDDEEGGETE